MSASCYNRRDINAKPLLGIDKRSVKGQYSGKNVNSLNGSELLRNQIDAQSIPSRNLTCRDEVSKPLEAGYETQTPTVALSSEIINPSPSSKPKTGCPISERIPSSPMCSFVFTQNSVFTEDAVNNSLENQLDYNRLRRHEGNPDASSDGKSIMKDAFVQSVEVNTGTVGGCPFTGEQPSLISLENPHQSSISDNTQPPNVCESNRVLRSDLILDFSQGGGFRFSEEIERSEKKCELSSLGDGYTLKRFRNLPDESKSNVREDRMPREKSLNSYSLSMDRRNRRRSRSASELVHCISPFSQFPPEENSLSSVQFFKGRHSSPLPPTASRDFPISRAISTDGRNKSLEEILKDSHAQTWSNADPSILKFYKEIDSTNHDLKVPHASSTFSLIGDKDSASFKCEKKSKKGPCLSSSWPFNTLDTRKDLLSMPSTQAKELESRKYINMADCLKVCSPRPSKVVRRNEKEDGKHPALLGVSLPLKPRDAFFVWDQQVSRKEVVNTASPCQFIPDKSAEGWELQWGMPEKQKMTDLHASSRSRDSRCQSYPRLSVLQEDESEGEGDGGGIIWTTGMEEKSFLPLTEQEVISHGRAHRQAHGCFSANAHRTFVGAGEGPHRVQDILDYNKSEKKSLDSAHNNSAYEFNNYGENNDESRSCSLGWEGPQTPLSVCPRLIAPRFDIFSYVSSHPSTSSVSLHRSNRQSQLNWKNTNSCALPSDLSNVGVKRDIDAEVRQVRHSICVVDHVDKMESRRSIFTEDEKVRRDSHDVGRQRSRSLFQYSPYEIPVKAKFPMSPLPTRITSTQLSTPDRIGIQNVPLHFLTNLRNEREEEEEILPLSSSTPPARELFVSNSRERRNISSSFFPSSFSFARAAVEGSFNELPSSPPPTREFSNQKNDRDDNSRSLFASLAIIPSKTACARSFSSLRTSGVLCTPSPRSRTTTTITINSNNDAAEAEEREKIFKDLVQKSDYGEKEVFDSSRRRSFESLRMLSSPKAFTPTQMRKCFHRDKIIPENFHVYYGFANSQGHRRKQEDYVAILPEIKVSCQKSTKVNNEEETKEIEKYASVGALNSSAASLMSATLAWEGESCANLSKSKRLSRVKKDFPEPSLCSPENEAAEELSFGCFAVFDGHGGDDVSRRAAHYFPRHFQAAVRAHYQLFEERSSGKSRGGENTPSQKDGKTGKEEMWSRCRTRLMSAALVQALLHVDFTIHKRIYGDMTRSRQRFSGLHAGSTSCIMAFYRSSGSKTPYAQQNLPIGPSSSSSNSHSTANHVKRSLKARSLSPPPLCAKTRETLYQVNTSRLSPSSELRGGKRFRFSFCRPKPPLPGCGSDPREEINPCARSGNTEKRKEKGEATENSNEESDEDHKEEDLLERDQVVRLSIANLGDCRAVIGALDSGALFFQTHDHRVRSCPGEIERIKKNGGNVLYDRVEGCLDITRGLGDYDYKTHPTTWWKQEEERSPSNAKIPFDIQKMGREDDAHEGDSFEQPSYEFTSSPYGGNIISNIADIYECEVRHHDFLLIASDGVWDYMSSAEVTAFVASELRRLLQEELVQGKARRWETPNTVPPASSFHLSEGSVVGAKKAMRGRLTSPCENHFQSGSEIFTREGWQPLLSPRESVNFEENYSTLMHSHSVLARSQKSHEEALSDGVSLQAPSLQFPRLPIVPSLTSIATDSKPLVDVEHGLHNETQNTYKNAIDNFGENKWNRALEEIPSAILPSLKAPGNERGERCFNRDYNLLDAMRSADDFQDSSQIPTTPVFGNSKPRFSCVSPLSNAEETNLPDIDKKYDNNSSILPLNLTLTKAIEGDQTSRHRLILQRTADHLVEHVLCSLNGSDNITVILVLFSFSQETTHERLGECLY